MNQNYVHNWEYILTIQNEFLSQWVTNDQLLEVLNNLTDELDNFDSSQAVSILFYKEEGLYPVAGNRIPKAWKKVINPLPLGKKSGSCGTAGYLKECVIVENILEDPLWEDYRDLQYKHGFMACWSHPILEIKTGNLLGTFAIYFKEPRKPTFFELKMIQFFANTVGIILERINQEHRSLSRIEEEKKSFLKEIHHRIKNNLQIVISLLKLQASKVEDIEVLKIFKESQNRILSMARLHEQLYESKFIDTKKHIISLTNALIKGYKLNIDVKLDIEVENVELSAKTLVPLGLILNEVISNSLKYGFINRTEGSIIVHLKHIEGIEYEIIIGDDGVGMGKDFSMGLGTELIKIFTDQLNGSITLLNKPGTLYKIRFEDLNEI
ncbi:MAG: GAF domain-containing protein [Flavobacteriales bacterium]|nr:GAF domain-containing protein [Flavobacteriales bacterium]